MAEEGKVRKRRNKGEKNLNQKSETGKVREVNKKSDKPSLATLEDLQKLKAHFDKKRS